MTNRKTKTAIVLTSAVALASGAYALGSQAGDGTAGAAGDDERPALVHSARGGPGDVFLGLDGLADRLGVQEDELRDALRDVRPERPAKPPGDFAEILADELGIEQSQVEDALDRVHDRIEKQHEQLRADFAKRLADRLNLDADEVEEALGDGKGPLKFRHPARP